MPEFSVCAVGYIVVLAWGTVNLVGNLGMILLMLIASDNEYFSNLG